MFVSKTARCTTIGTTRTPGAARFSAGFYLLIAVSFLFRAEQGFCQTFDTFLEPSQIVDISSPFRNRITDIHVGIGDRVKAGQLLAELDSQVLRATLDSAETAASFQGRIDSAKALVSMQQDRYKMLQELEKSGNARPQELVKAHTDLVMARAQLQSALDDRTLKKHEAGIIRAQIEERKLRSPVDGVVVKISRQQAELIGGGDGEEFMTVVQLDPLLAVFHVPPDISRNLQEGAGIPLESGGARVTGEIDFISPVINAQSGTVEVRVTITNPDNKLISGSRCTFSKQ